MTSVSNFCIQLFFTLIMMQLLVISGCSSLQQAISSATEASDTDGVSALLVTLAVPSSQLASLSTQSLKLLTDDGQEYVTNGNTTYEITDALGTAVDGLTVVDLENGCSILTGVENLASGAYVICATIPNGDETTVVETMFEIVAGEEFVNVEELIPNADWSNLAELVNNPPVVEWSAGDLATVFAGRDLDIIEADAKSTAAYAKFYSTLEEQIGGPPSSIGDMFQNGGADATALLAEMYSVFQNYHSAFDTLPPSSFPDMSYSGGERRDDLWGGFTTVADTFISGEGFADQISGVIDNLKTNAYIAIADLSEYLPEDYVMPPFDFGPMVDGGGRTFILPAGVKFNEHVALPDAYITLPENMSVEGEFKLPATWVDNADFVANGFPEGTKFNAGFSLENTFENDAPYQGSLPLNSEFHIPIPDYFGGEGGLPSGIIFKDGAVPPADAYIPPDAEFDATIEMPSDVVLHPEFIIPANVQLPDDLVHPFPNGIRFAEDFTIKAAWDNKFPEDFEWKGSAPVFESDFVIPVGHQINGEFTVPADMHFADGYTLPPVNYEAGFVVEAGHAFDPAFRFSGEMTIGDGFQFTDAMKDMVGTDFEWKDNFQYATDFVMDSDFQSKMESGFVLDANMANHLANDFVFNNNFTVEEGFVFTDELMHQIGDDYQIPEGTYVQEGAYIPEGVYIPEGTYIPAI